MIKWRTKKRKNRQLAGWILSFLFVVVLISIFSTFIKNDRQGPIKSSNKSLANEHSEEERKSLYK